MSRLVYGARASLMIGVVANAAAVFIGTLLGMIAGYVGGWVGAIIMRFTDLMMAFPALLLAIALAAILKPSLWIVALVIALVNWVQIARVIYTQTRSLVEREFIEAARALGAGWPRLLGVHVMPHLRVGRRIDLPNQSFCPGPFGIPETRAVGHPVGVNGSADSPRELNRAAIECIAICRGLLTEQRMPNDRNDHRGR